MALLRIEAAATGSTLVRQALELARAAHAGQTRSGSGGMDYIEHPIAVAELLADNGFGEEAVAAALLHDVVEDSDTGIEEIERDFGPEVASLVATLTDDQEIEPYQQRKDEHRRGVERAGGDAAAIYAADKLSNIRTLRKAYADLGEDVGEEFAPSLDVKEAVWRDDLAMLRRRAPQLPFLDALEMELEQLALARDRA